jgi:hypothetical protein
LYQSGNGTEEISDIVKDCEDTPEQLPAFTLAHQGHTFQSSQTGFVSDFQNTIIANPPHGIYPSPDVAYFGSKPLIVDLEQILAARLKRDLATELDCILREIDGTQLLDSRMEEPDYPGELITMRATAQRQPNDTIFGCFYTWAQSDVN